MNLSQLIFDGFAALLLGSALMVISTRHPVRAVLFLILAFFASAVIWMLLEAEFLSLALIFVYVGAVMTLFLFVVMMLNVESIQPPKRWWIAIPMSLAVGGGLVLLLAKYLAPTAVQTAPALPADFNHVRAIGEVLYTQYALPFELAAVVLLVAIISSISLAFRGRRPGTKTQVVAEQVTVRAEDRLRIVKMNPDKP